MTENSSGENNIESLAQRAKEVLDRVRANVDDPTRSSLTAPDFSPPSDDLGRVDLDVGDETGTHETSDTDGVDEVSDVDEHVRDEATEEAVRPETEEPEAEEPEAEEPEAEEPEAEEPEAEEADRSDAALAAGLTAIQPVDQTEVEPPAEVERAAETGDDTNQVSTSLAAEAGIEAEGGGDEPADRRAIGWLIPLILLAIAVLALIMLVTYLLDSSDDDESSSNGTPQTTITTTTAAPETTESPTTDSDTTSTEPTTSTSTTSPTEGPPVLPATAWELLGEASNTDEFASFAGPLGLQALLEAPPADDGSGGFTLFAPSNEAMAALSQEQLAALSLDPAAAQALVDYHLVDGRLTQEMLVDVEAGQIQSSVGLPITVAPTGGGVLLNGTVPLSADTLESLNGNVIVIDAVLEPPTINSVINLGDVQFEVISAIITPEGQAELQKAVAFFTANPDANAVIQGHTDTDGPAEPNQRLSERRAQAVREYLISQGIDGARLAAEGFGESQPILVDGVEDKAASRRIEFLLR